MIGFLKFLPSIVGAVTFSILAAAFIHELAFYSVIGTQYQSLLSVTDYFNSAVPWLPWAALFIIIGGLVSFTDPSRHIPEGFYKAHRLRWFLDRGFYVLFFAFFILAGAIQFLFGNWYARTSAMQFLFMFVWMWLVRSWFMREKRIADAKAEAFNPASSMIILVLAIPIVMVIIFIDGLGEGAQALSKREPVHFLKLGNDEKEVRVFVVRILAGGAIIRRLDGNRLEYAKWDDVASFQSEIEPINKNGLICRVTGYACNTGLYQ